MATSTKTPAKKTPAKKTASKRAAAKKTAATTKVTEPAAAVPSEGPAEMAGHLIHTVARFAVDAANTFVGVGLVVVQDGIKNRSFDHVSYSTFVDDARKRGHDLTVDIQSKVEPYAERVESRLPQRIQDVVDGARDRARELLDA